MYKTITVELTEKERNLVVFACTQLLDDWGGWGPSDDEKNLRAAREKLLDIAAHNYKNK